MIPTSAVYAGLEKTRGSRVNDPSFEWYLRHEFLGGGAMEELMKGAQPRTTSTMRGAIDRFIRVVLLNLNRLKPAPAPVGR